VHLCSTKTAHQLPAPTCACFLAHLYVNCLRQRVLVFCKFIRQLPPTCAGFLQVYTPIACANVCLFSASLPLFSLCRQNWIRVQSSDTSPPSQKLTCPITDSAGPPYSTLQLTGGEKHAKRYGPDNFSCAEVAAVEEFAKHIATFLETIVLSEAAKSRRGG
jgi:hypothetical protein